MASFQAVGNHGLSAVGVDMVGVDMFVEDAVEEDIAVEEVSCSDAEAFAVDFCYSVRCSRGEGSSAFLAKPVQIFH